ncbi:MAG TPA: hypothetical protein VNJ01_15190 [Bacteriovoracaceae bacterium]|nr:hypothetical protein [Bacteriovoracaceae bacterium]
MLKFFFACLVLASVNISAQDVIPGLIPRFYSIEAAVDLPVSAEIAHERALRGEDLSLMQPDAKTNIWLPGKRMIPTQNLIAADEKVEFVKELPSRSGQVRFTVRTRDSKEYIVILSKKIHTFVMRRNLLVRLGYATQPMSWVPRIGLSFADSVDKELFKKLMESKLLAGSERWIRADSNLEMVVLDALVQTPEAEIYNLASGLMARENHQGRRLLRAPYVALAMVDTTESVNLMPWQAGRMVLNHVKLNHTQDLDTTYGTSWEDARWIGRRIAKLTREDLEEIVRKSFYPPAVEKLMIEKVVSRRNDLLVLLQLEKEFTPLPFNPEVSFGTGLIGGEIVQEFFDGYVTRFSYGDPESPFSSTELGSFALSRAQSQLISTAMEKLNSYLGTNVEAKYNEKLRDIILNEGPLHPTHAIVIPSFHGSIILSRDIVTGSYLGTNNKVQLVDNFGIGMDAGVFGGIEGLPFPVAFKGGAGLTFQRVYSHVKPVQSLKKSLKDPYKNMFVPMLLKNFGQKVDKLDGIDSNLEVSTVQSIVGDLKSMIGVGESFIITDSIVPRAFGEAQLSLSQYFFLDDKLLKVHGRIQSERMMLTRFHFHRADENTFQIYQDYGKNLKLLMSVKLKSYVPLLSFSGRWNKASAETFYYPIVLQNNGTTPELLKALRQSIFSLNHDALQDVVKPHRVEHAIKEGGSTLQFLIFKRNKIGSDQSMSITHAQGGTDKKIYRRYDAVTSGTDVESYATEALNSLIGIFLKSDLAISQVPSLNPGFSLGGKAKNKIFTSEFDGSRMTTNFQRIFNGWKAKPGKLRDLIKTVNKEAGTEVFNPLSIISTDSILLYKITFTYLLTQEGTDRLLNSSAADLKRILSTHAQEKVGLDRINQLAANYSKRLAEVASELVSSDPTNGMKRYHGLLKDLQDVVTIKGLEALAGKDNIAYQGRIEGFRQGDENGDNPVLSHVYGELPLPLHSTPTQQIIQNWGILEGELLANWLMERAI